MLFFVKINMAQRLRTQKATWKTRHVHVQSSTNWRIQSHSTNIRKTKNIETSQNSDDFSKDEAYQN